MPCTVNMLLLSRFASVIFGRKSTAVCSVSHFRLSQALLLDTNVSKAMIPTHLTDRPFGRSYRTFRSDPFRLASPARATPKKKYKTLPQTQKQSLECASDGVALNSHLGRLLYAAHRRTTKPGGARRSPCWPQSELTRRFLEVHTGFMAGD